MSPSVDIILIWWRWLRICKNFLEKKVPQGALWVKSFELYLHNNRHWAWAEVVYKNNPRCHLSPLSFNHPHNSRYDCILIYILFWVKVLLHIWNWACNLILLIMILDYFKDKPSLLEVCLPSYTCLLPNPTQGSHFSEISEIPNSVYATLNFLVVHKVVVSHFNTSMASIHLISSTSSFLFSGFLYLRELLIFCFKSLLYN